MAVIDNLTMAKLQVSSILVQLTVNPKPTYSIGGKSLSWGEYFSMLTEQMAKLNELIQVEGSPVEIVTEGKPG